MPIVILVLLVILSFLLLALLYYYILLLASILPERKRRRLDDTSKIAKSDNVSFTIVIPAHNEETLIGRTVSAMLGMKYDKALFDVMVVADNCSDKTSEVARSSGALCFERHDSAGIGKGQALEWFLKLKREEFCRRDAIVVFDADSQPAETFLSVMSSKLLCGYQVLQGQHLISNPEDNTLTALADIGMRLTNRLRNLARRNLGLSCRLMGDAMCISSSVVRELPWNASSLVEDRDYGLELVKQGIHIHYVPEAVSRGEAPVALEVANKQRVRWTSGVMGLRRRHTAALLSNGLRNRSLSSLDMAVELILPPYSVLVLLSLILLFPPLLFSTSIHPAAVPLFYLNAAAWLLIPVFGLLLDGDSIRLFPYILLGPLYALWRMSTIMIAVIRGNQVKWVRTERRDETPTPEIHDQHRP